MRAIKAGNSKKKGSADLKIRISKPLRHYASEIVQDCASLDQILCELENEVFKRDLTGKKYRTAMDRNYRLHAITQRLKSHASGLEFGAALTE
jgi:hypothetical protein